MGFVHDRTLTLFSDNEIEASHNIIYDFGIMLDLVIKVPNINRIYYLKRTQPLVLDFFSPIHTEIEVSRNMCYNFLYEIQHNDKVLNAN